MKFRERISAKQSRCIAFFGMSIILLIYINKNIPQFIFIARYVIYATLVITVYEFYNETRRKYIISHPYQQNHYDSKKEEIIANYFKSKSIIFVHNKVIKVPKILFWKFSIPFVNVTMKPDFFLPEYDVYVEYWGLMNDEKYKQDRARKMKLYNDNDLDIISLYEQNLFQRYEKDYNRLDWDFTQKLMEVFKQRQGISRTFDK